mgnify:CR=1 FL=1
MKLLRHKTAGMARQACLALALFWVLRALPRQRPVLFWGGLGVLVFVYTVPLWEHPVYDGYWIVLGIVGLLLALNGSLWAGQSA